MYPAAAMKEVEMDNIQKDGYKIKSTNFPLGLPRNCAVKNCATTKIRRFWMRTAFSTYLISENVLLTCMMRTSNQI